MLKEIIGIEQYSQECVTFLVNEIVLLYLADPELSPISREATVEAGEQVLSSLYPYEGKKDSLHS